MAGKHQQQANVLLALLADFPVPGSWLLIECYSDSISKTNEDGDQRPASSRLRRAAQCNYTRTALFWNVITAPAFFPMDGNSVITSSGFIVWNVILEQAFFLGEGATRTIFSYKNIRIWIPFLSSGLVIPASYICFPKIWVYISAYFPTYEKNLQISIVLLEKCQSRSDHLRSNSSSVNYLCFSHFLYKNKTKQQQKHQQ